MDDRDASLVFGDSHKSTSYPKLEQNLYNSPWEYSRECDKHYIPLPVYIVIALKVELMLLTTLIFALKPFPFALNIYTYIFIFL